MSFSDEDICDLLECCVQTNYRAKSANETVKAIMKKCVELAKLDYYVSILDNSSGELCAHYPSEIIIFESELNWTGEQIKDTDYEGIDPQKIRESFQKARSARCRARFPVPVLFYQGKYVCRSATLSGGPEISGRSGMDYSFAGADNNSTNESQTEEDNEDTSLSSNCNNWVLCDQVRKEDIQLLKELNVGTIIDFIVEKKKVKFGGKVTSSEKVDKENRYANFTIMSLPYPGCEFFRELRGQNYDASNLQYNWEQSQMDPQLIMPPDEITEKIGIKWGEYKTWSLARMTDNYLQVILKYLFDGSTGMLVHCISGWNRTPLFISLVRILLWADGAIHRKLTPAQMLYFTISYDWLLFAHNFPDRWHKGEDIFFFCFDHLKNLMGDEFLVPKVCKIAQAIQLAGLYMIPNEMMQCEVSDLDSEDFGFNLQGSNHSPHSSGSSISSKGHEMNPGLVDNVNTQEELNNGVTPTSDANRSAIDTPNSGSLKRKHSTELVTTPSPVAVPLSPHTGRVTPTSDANRSAIDTPNSGSLKRKHSTELVTTPSPVAVPMSPHTGRVTPTSDANRSAIDTPNSGSFKRKHSTEDANCDMSCKMRRRRLENLRELFVKCYRRSIGHNMADGEVPERVLEKMGSIAGISREQLPYFLTNSLSS